MKGKEREEMYERKGEEKRDDIGTVRESERKGREGKEKERKREGAEK